MVEDVAGTLLRTPHSSRRAYWFALSGLRSPTFPVGALVLSEDAQPLRRSSKRLLEQLASAIAS